MGDKSDFVLRLLDRLTAPARAMTRALRGLREAKNATADAAARAQKAIGGVGAAAARAGAQAAGAAAGFRQLSTAAYRFKSMGGRALTGSLSELSSLSLAQPMGPVFDRAQQRKHMGLWDNLRIDTQPFWKWNKAAGETLEKWGELRAAFMRTPFGLVLSGLGSITSALFSLVTGIGTAVAKVGALGLGLGALAAGALTKASIEMAAFGERARQALGYVTGDKRLGGLAFEHGVKLAKELGLNTEETVTQLAKLRSMQFSIREGTELIRLSTDLKAIAGDSQAAERALTAITQIKAKGKLQSEELVGQLAEAGVSTVLVYQELEKLLKTDRAGVLKMLQSGSVDAETGIRAIKAAILHKLNATEAGQVGRDFANNTLTGLWEQLKNAPSNLALRISDFLDIDPVKQSIRELLTAFETVDASRVGTFVQKLLGAFTRLVPAVIAFGEGFGESFGRIIDALTFGEGDVQTKARDAGRWLAEFFGHAIELVKRLSDTLPPAVESFMKGLDVNGILEGLTSADWEKFGSNLAVIANALGSITTSAAKLAGWFLPETNSLRQTIVDPANITDKQRQAGERALSAIKEASLWNLMTAMLANGSGLQNTLLSAEPKTAPAPPSSGRTGRSTSVGRIEQNIYMSGGDPYEVREKGKEGLIEAFSSLDGAYAQ